MKELFARNNQEKNKEADKIYLAQCFQRAIKYQVAGNIDAAKRFYGLATINNKKMIPEAAYNLAIIYKQENNIKKAIHYFEAGYQKDKLKQKSARQLYCLCEKEGLSIEADFWLGRIDLSKLATKEKDSSSRPYF
ncbi:MAG: hypothetical protein KBD23_03440 [Gammaproteobacteria bacterium]|nr:hypothetical protein [Gammaproteobacteria bacterium]MBP9729179.1 hypothetical protein [Gammaproteobacteria bacterium]